MEKKKTIVKRVEAKKAKLEGHYNENPSNPTE